MHFARLSVFRLALLAAASLLGSLAPSAHADTYSLTVVDHTQRENFYGIDNVGNFIVNRNNNPIYAGPGSTCGSVANAPTCYETFFAGSPTPVFSVAPPSLAFDNGSACRPALGSGFSVLSGLCNGDHFLVSAFYDNGLGSTLRGIWGGPNPDPIASFLGGGTIDGGFINSLGDAVFIDGFHDTLVFADDLSTSPSAVPEPSTLALLGAGSLALLGRIRRRR